MRGTCRGVARDRGWKVFFHVDPRCGMHLCGISVTWLLVLQVSWNFRLILGAGFAGNPAPNDPGQNYPYYGRLGEKRGRSDDFLGTNHRSSKWMKHRDGPDCANTRNSSGRSPTDLVGPDDLEAYEGRSYASGSPVPFRGYIPMDLRSQEDSCSSEGEEDVEMSDYVPTHTASPFSGTTSGNQ